MEVREFQIHLLNVDRTLDLGPWKIDNYEYLLGLKTWDPGNTRTPQLLITRDLEILEIQTSITWEPGRIGKQTILMT